MSAPGLEKAPTQPPSPSLGMGPISLNSALIPGGTGSVEMPGEIEVCGIRWTPADGHAHSCSIGAALALEMVGKG